MPTTANKPATKKTHKIHQFELSGGEVLIVRRRFDPEQIKKTTEEVIAQMHRRKKRGDVVESLQEFRNTPRSS
jgi:hypothetical protein